MNLVESGLLRCQVHHLIILLRLRLHVSGSTPNTKPALTPGRQEVCAVASCESKSKSFLPVLRSIAAGSAADAIVVKTCNLLNVLESLAASAQALYAFVQALGM